MQKMEAVGTLAGGIAHEFNNINGDIIAYLDLSLEMEELPGSIRRNLETIRSLATGGVELTKSLLTFSRKDVGEMKPAALRDIVDRVLMIAGNQLAREGIEVAVEHGGRPNGDGEHAHAGVRGDEPLHQRSTCNAKVGEEESDGPDGDRARQTVHKGE